MFFIIKYYLFIYLFIMQIIVKLLEYIYEEMKINNNNLKDGKKQAKTNIERIQDEYNEVYNNKLYIKILQITSSVFRKKNIFNESRKLFTEKGGTSVLLNIPSVAYDEIASTAIITIGDLIKNSLYIKEYIGN